MERRWRPSNRKVCLNYPCQSGRDCFSSFPAAPVKWTKWEGGSPATFLSNRSVEGTVQHAEMEHKRSCQRSNNKGGKSLVIHILIHLSRHYRPKVPFHHCARNESSLFEDISFCAEHWERIKKNKYLVARISDRAAAAAAADDEFVQGFLTKFNESLTLCRLSFLVDRDRRAMRDRISRS